MSKWGQKYEAFKNRLLIVSARCLRRMRNPEKYKTLSFFCNYLKEENVRLNACGMANYNRVIHEVCTLDSSAGYESFYFPSRCACLISSYEDGIAAVKKGALILISREDFPDLPCMIADDILSVFAKWCGYYRDLQRKVSIIAVSGSIGKTTVKNMMGEVMKTKYITSYTQSNYNTRMSVGFSVQHIPDNAEIMVQEIHEGNPFETKYISKMLRPDIFVVTPIDKSHISRFASAEAIVEEVCSIVEYMPSDGRIVINIDEFRRFDLLYGRKCITVSTKNPDADFFADEITRTQDGLIFTVHVKQSGTGVCVKLNNIFALHNVECALYAFAAAYIVGVDPQNIVNGLNNYKTQGVRQNIFRTYSGVLVYADCFNAAGKSMKSAIETAGTIPVTGRRIAVLGNVEEAGEESVSLHREIVGYVKNSCFDILYTIGDKMNDAVAGLDDNDELLIKTFNSLKDLSDAIRSTAKAGDLVLFKASHAIQLAHCIKSIWPREYKDFVQGEDKNGGDWIKKSVFY